MIGHPKPNEREEDLVAENVLYYGDNLGVLQQHVKGETVDLVYLDPPFNSAQDYNVLFAEHGTRAAAQIKAFEDTWQWDESAARAYADVVEKSGKVSLAMQSFWTFLGENDMLAYLSMMAPRLVELRRVMKPTASIYLHCDPTPPREPSRTNCRRMRGFTPLPSRPGSGLQAGSSLICAESMISMHPLTLIAAGH
jgi:DNA modification methylase